LKTHVQVYQQGSYPGQYESTICRIKLNETLVELALNPNARSNISLGLIINLLKRASLDSVSKVSKFCMSSISTLERLVHPSSQSIEFPSTLHLIEHGSNVDQSSVILNNLLKNQAVSEQEIVDGIRQDMVETITVDTESQTEIPITENGIGEEEEQTTNKISLKEIMSKLQQLTEKVQELSSSNHHQQQNSAVFRQYTLSSSLDSLSGHSSRTQTLSQQQINNDSGVNKRKLFNDDADVSIITNGQTKKCKPCDSDQDQADLNSSIADITDNTIDRTEITVTTTTSDDVIEMCKDFVDVEALHALAV
jgi:negative regulator of replication initiation